MPGAAASNRTGMPAISPGPICQAGGCRPSKAIRGPGCPPGLAAVGDHAGVSTALLGHRHQSSVQKSMVLVGGAHAPGASPPDTRATWVTEAAALRQRDVARPAAGPGQQVPNGHIRGPSE